MSTAPRRPGQHRLDGVHAVRDDDATWTMQSPNPLGLHRVRVVAFDGNAVEVDGLEAVDGTPVVDLKPLLGPVDER